MTILNILSVLTLAGMAMHQFALKKAIHALLIPQPVHAITPKNRYS